tara:strand:- start:260 stop:493 length:234 start_codon:yes stop_codon:yes gene_type:complete
MLYTYTFCNHLDGINSPINAYFKIPIRGCDNEGEAYRTLTELPLFDVGISGDYWGGLEIGAAIVCDVTEEHNEEINQ